MCVITRRYQQLGYIILIVGNLLLILNVAWYIFGLKTVSDPNYCGNNIDNIGSGTCWYPSQWGFWDKTIIGTSITVIGVGILVLDWIKRPIPAA